MPNQSRMIEITGKKQSRILLIFETTYGLNYYESFEYFWICSSNIFFDPISIEFEYNVRKRKKNQNIIRGSS